MYAHLTASALAQHVNARESEIQRYVRWEYGAAGADWLLAAARAGPLFSPRSTPSRRATKPSARQRVARWVASLRGPTSDVRQRQEPALP